MVENAEQLKNEFTKLNNWLQQQKISHKVKFSKPIALSKIEEAEKKIGVTFPPSYKNFVTQYGVFKIPGELTGEGFRNNTILFNPEEMVENTLYYRNELAASADQESQEILADGLFFCADPEGEHFYLFVISSADQTGEMNTRPYDYQDPANNDPWYEGDGTFAESIQKMISRVKKNILEENQNEM